MASLTQSAIIARKGVRYSIYGLVVLLSARLVFGAVYGVYKKIFPTPPPEPTVLFGPLPQIQFPDTSINTSALTYSLQTPSGKLPVLQEQSVVYLVSKDLPTLFSVDQGKQIGALLGFNTDPIKLTETLFRFRHTDLPKTLEINVVTNIFSMSYDLAADPTPITSLPPTPEVATTQVKAYLNGAGILPDDLTGPTFHEYLRADQGQLVPALSLSDAHLTKINLTRKSYDDLPSMGPDPEQANVWFLVSGSTQQEKRILAGEFHYVGIDPDKSSTYPLITAEEAYADLTNGNAYIAKAPEAGQVVIRNVYLANYDPDRFEEFIEPIVVFEGDGFLAYVPAIAPKYYGR